jgi:aminoglycoside phosphotransferase
MNEQLRALERQRKKDCDYLLKQENELEKMREQRQQAVSLNKVNEEQVVNLKQLLNTTISVKIKYENIIKRLVENDKCRDLVLTIIEQV